VERLLVLVVLAADCVGGQAGPLERREQLGRLGYRKQLLITAVAEAGVAARRQVRMAASAAVLAATLVQLVV
jgi:hypothetical protein